MFVELPQLNEGEHYAGICIVDGKVSHHLVLLPQESPDVTWQGAIDWAKSVNGELPTRFEAALLYANLRDKADNDYWHWTATLVAGYESSAWIQVFGDGGQYYGHKGGHGRARAVRRVEIAT